MYRAAIIGTGRIASSLEKDPLRGKPCTHAGEYQLCPDTELVAGADIDRSQLEAFGIDWNIAKGSLYSDYNHMLRSEHPDIVSVAAYAPERLEMALASLSAGAKGLLLEKAVGCSLSEAEAIRKAVRENGAQAVVDYPRRGRAPYRKIKKLIESREYGSLQSVTCHMSSQLIHTGTHAFDVIRYWCGEAISLRGSLEGKPVSGPIVDQGGMAEIQTTSGAQVFVSAYQKKYYIFQFDLIFESARILIGNDIATVYLPGKSKNYTGFQELFPDDDFNWGPAHPRSILGELVHSMQTGQPPLFSVHNAVEALRISLAIFESAARGGVAVDPQQIDPDLRIESK